MIEHYKKFKIKLYSIPEFLSWKLNNFEWSIDNVSYSNIPSFSITKLLTYAQNFGTNQHHHQERCSNNSSSILNSVHLFLFKKYEINKK